MEYKDYYRVLGVERSASQDEIKRAYRKLVRKYHPDVNTGPDAADAEKTFMDVGEAYEVLQDPEKRTAYDQLGAGIKEGQAFRPPPIGTRGSSFRVADIPMRTPKILVPSLRDYSAVAPVRCRMRARNGTSTRPVRTIMQRSSLICRRPTAGAAAILHFARRNWGRTGVLR